MGSAVPVLPVCDSGNNSMWQQQHPGQGSSSSLLVYRLSLCGPLSRSPSGDASAWGCCPGSVLFTRLSACRQLSASTCSLSPQHCMLHGGACLPTPEEVTRVVFTTEAEKLVPAGGSSIVKEATGHRGGPQQWNSAAELARTLLSMPRQCATMGVEECGSYGAAELDSKLLSSYSMGPSQQPVPMNVAAQAAVAGKELYSDPSVCIRAAVKAAEELVDSDLVDQDMQQVLIEERPQEDEDVVF